MEEKIRKLLTRDDLSADEIKELADELVDIIAEEEEEEENADSISK